jgi:hypothetical protein
MLGTEINEDLAVLRNDNGRMIVECDGWDAETGRPCVAATVLERPEVERLRDACDEFLGR